MSTPRLLRRDDIWNNFPVSAKPLGRGADGADRHGIEWHRANLRNMAREAGKSEEDLKREIQPRLMRALQASPSWTVEPAGGAGSPYIAVIAMKFQTRKANKTNVANWRGTVRANKPKTPSPSPASLTRKAPRRLGANVTDVVREGRGMIQKTTEKNVDTMVPKFVALVPETDDDSKELMKMVYDLAVDQQFFHPVTMKFIRGMNAAQEKTDQYHKLPSDVISKMAYEMAKEGATYVAEQIRGNNENLANSAENRINKGKRAFRSNLLFFGYLFHQDMLEFKKLKKILKQYKKELKAEDYRQQDAAIEALLYVLVRAGKAMSLTEEGMELLEDMIATLKSVVAEIPRVRMKVMFEKFMDAVNHDYRMENDVPWAVGAPEEGVRAKVAKTRRSPKPEGLGADIGELWRRFPLAVKQQGDRYDISFHGMKLKDRFTRNAGRHATLRNLQGTLERHILALIDNSEHWQRGPAVPGTFVTVVKK